MSGSWEPWQHFGFCGMQAWSSLLLCLLVQCPWANYLSKILFLNHCQHVSLCNTWIALFLCCWGWLVIQKMVYQELSIWAMPIGDARLYWMQLSSWCPALLVFFELHTLVQFTGQWPLLASSTPFHKKFLLILSIHLIAHLKSGNAVIWYDGMAESTDCTSDRRPDFVSSFPFQPGNLAPILSISTCSASLRNRPICRGNPRYLHGNWHTFPWKFPINADSPQLICYTSVWYLLPIRLLSWRQLVSSGRLWSLAVWV